MGFLFAATKKGLKVEAAMVYFENYHQVYSDPLLSLILCLLIVNALQHVIERCSSLLSVIVKFV